MRKRFKQRIYLIDIDGVIADYAEAMARFYSQMLGIGFEKKDMEQIPMYGNFNDVINENKYEELKNIYRKYNYKMTMKPIRGYKTFYIRFIERGSDEIVFYTTRPVKTPYQKNRQLTKDWLKMHNINYDTILFADDFENGKEDIIYDFSYEQYDKNIFVIDDDPEIEGICKKIPYNNIKFFLFVQPYNKNAKVGRKVKNLREFVNGDKKGRIK